MNFISLIWDSILLCRAILEELQTKFHLKKLPEVVTRGWNLNGCVWHYGMCVSGKSGPSTEEVTFPALWLQLPFHHVFETMFWTDPKNALQCSAPMRQRLKYHDNVHWFQVTSPHTFKLPMWKRDAGLSTWFNQQSEKFDFSIIQMLLIDKVTLTARVKRKSGIWKVTTWWTSIVRVWL